MFMVSFDFDYIKMIKIQMVLLTFSLLLKPSNECQTEYNFGNSFCSFQVQPLPSDCNQFTFSSCSYTSCKEQAGMACQQPFIETKYKWDECTRKCCDPTAKYSINAQGIRQCQFYLDWTFYLSIWIPVVCILGVGLLIFTIFCCCCCHQHCPKGCQTVRRRLLKSYECLQNWVVYIFCCMCFRKDNFQVTDENHNQEGLSPSPLQQQTSTIWRTDNIWDPQLENICNVCLDSETLIRLKCGHIFHPKCLVTWIRRKVVCVCQSSDFDPIKIYCASCFNFYFQTTLLDNLDQIQQNQYVCPRCSEMELSREPLKE